MANKIIFSKLVPFCDLNYVKFIRKIMTTKTLIKPKNTNFKNLFRLGKESRDKVES